MSRPRHFSNGERVVHVTTVHQPHDPRIYHKQLATLQDAGFDTHLVAPHSQSEVKDGISLHALPRPQNRGHRLLLQPRVYRTARALDADLYQIHDPELLPLARLLKKSTGARLVYDMHEDYRSKGPVVGRTLRALERWAFRWLDHVLLAEDSYHSIVRSHPVPTTYIANYFVPIGDGDPQNADPDPERPAPTRLLYTGTLAKSRGLYAMVKLATLIGRADRSETVDLVGVCHHEAQRAWVENQIRRENLDGIITRVGWDAYVQPADMPPHYRQADVGLALFESHPNYEHSLPTKFYEYLQYGLPIICSDLPRWRQFVAQHECGAVVPQGTPKAVLQVLDEWQAHPEKYRRCAQNAREAASEYRWETMGNRLVSVYRDLLDGTERE